METTTTAMKVGSGEWLEKAFTFTGNKTQDTTSKLDKIQAGAQNLAKLIIDLTPEGTDREEALTSLRTSTMYAAAAITQKSLT